MNDHKQARITFRQQTLMLQLSTFFNNLTGK